MSVETIDAFIARHGGEYYHSKELNRYVLPDGASLYSPQGGPHSRGISALHGPPEDPQELLKMKRAYLVAKLDPLVERFKAMRNEALNQCNDAVRFSENCPPPPTNTAEILRQMKAPIDALKQQIADIDAELAEQPQAIGLRANAEHMTARKAAIAAQAREIGNITI